MSRRRGDIAPVWFLILILAAALITEALVSQGVDERSRSNYCEMVDLHKSSNGENGWPDYKKSYDKECATEAVSAAQ